MTPWGYTDGERIPPRTGTKDRRFGIATLPAGEVNPSELASYDLLVVGSLTQGSRPTPTTKEFLSKIPANTLENVSVTSFDTKLSTLLATDPSAMPPGASQTV